MNALDYAATYAVYVISTGVTIFVILRGWAYVLSAGNRSITLPPTPPFT